MLFQNSNKTGKIQNGAWIYCDTASSDFMHFFTLTSPRFTLKFFVK